MGAEEKGWLIERDYNGRVRYWNGQGRLLTAFSESSNDAVRFAREVDAAKVVSGVLCGDGRVAEHIWTDP